MRRWFILLFIFGVAALPFSVHAQGVIKFSTLQVQLWPEYDQPGMRVICEFKLADGTSLPADITVNIPKNGKLTAVASLSNGQLMLAGYDGPTANGNWQTIQVKVDTATTYHIVYYIPISKTGTERQYNYLWPGGDYPVNDFSIVVWPAVDTTHITTDPQLNLVTNSDGSTSWKKDIGALTANQPFTLKLNYTKTSDTLTKTGVQSSQPIGSNTLGSAMSTFGNGLPYFLGGLGLLALGGAIVYAWQLVRGGGNKPRRRNSPRGETEGDSEVYCHQCGTRAHKGDSFCRICGTKLRREA
jgi:hypothetical protein